MEAFPLKNARTVYRGDIPLIQKRFRYMSENLVDKRKEYIKGVVWIWKFLMSSS